MATIRLRVLSAITRKRKADSSEIFPVTGITSDSQIAMIFFEDEQFLPKLQVGSNVALINCKTTPKNDTIMINIQENTQVVTVECCCYTTLCILT